MWAKINPRSVFFKVQVHCQIVIVCYPFFRGLSVLSLKRLYIKVVIFSVLKRENLNYLPQQHQTRRVTMGLLREDRRNTALGQRCYDFLGPRLFNMLPLSLRHNTARHIFKLNLKKYLLRLNEDSDLENVF